MSDAVALDWSAAEVHDGELTVPLHGETPKGFKRAFRHTIRLLGEHSGWGEIELHKGVVQVADVTSGSEATLRHHLEGVVTQANAAVAQPAEEPADAPPVEEGPDAQMTERFRAFATEEPAEAPAAD